MDPMMFFNSDFFTLLPKPSMKLSLTPDLAWGRGLRRLNDT
jgi:hypothetical protein